MAGEYVEALVRRDGHIRGFAHLCGDFRLPCNRTAGGEANQSVDIRLLVAQHLSAPAPMQACAMSRADAE